MSLDEQLARAARHLAATNDTPTPGGQPQLRQRQGVVAAVNDDGRAMVNVGGDTAVGPFSSLGSYGPQPGDVVWMLKNGPDWLIIGSVGVDLSTHVATVIDSTPIPIASSTTGWVYPEYDTVIRDPWGMFDPALPFRLYARRSGTFSASANVSFSTNGSGYRRVNFRVDGDDNLVVGDDLRPSVTGVPSRMCVSTPDFFLEAGQFVQARYQQNSGSALTLEPTVYSTKLTLRRTGN